MISAKEAARLFDSCAIEARRKRIAFKLEYIDSRIRKACASEERIIDVDVEDEIVAAVAQALVAQGYDVNSIHKGLRIAW